MTDCTKDADAAKLKFGFASSSKSCPQTRAKKWGWPKAVAFMVMASLTLWVGLFLVLFH